MIPIYHKKFRSTKKKIKNPQKTKEKKKTAGIELESIKLIQKSPEIQQTSSRYYFHHFRPVHMLVQAYLRDNVGLLPDHHNEVSHNPVYFLILVVEGQAFNL